MIPVGISAERSPRRFWLLHSATATNRHTVWWLIQQLVAQVGLIAMGFSIGFLCSSFLAISISMTDIPWTSKSLLPLSYNAKCHDGTVTRRLMDNNEHNVVTGADEGWNMIHVFVGTQASKIEHMIDASTIPNDYFYRTTWFSQLRQDEVVYRLLRSKRNGYFIDLAANDAIRISNTFALEHYHGWNGIAIEPNPIYWSGLAYRNCTVVAAVIGQQTGIEMAFKFPKSKPAPQGGLVGPTFDNHDQSSKTNEDEMRYTITISDVFARFDTPSVIDYFSLDIEGAETFVMEAFPFDQYRINVLTVERADKRLCELLQQNGYTQMKQLKKWGETLWLHSSIIHDSAVIDLTALDIDTENYKYRERLPSKSREPHDTSIA